ncbi:MAG: glycosyltransferase [Deltaproteobacteria bacterium]|jgi:glycosyltransferase involved in cell wall biosynthesis|nr:glycosyltransferase [Deltaproteobacteria bacterium]
MQIVVLTTCYPRFAGDFAGAHVERSVRRLLALGHRVTVVAPADDRAEPSTFEGGAVVRRARYLPRRWRRLPYGYGGIPVHLRAHPLRVLEVPFLIAGLALEALRASRGADLLHANWLFTALAAWPARVARRLPVLVTLRGSDLALAEAAAPLRLVAGRLLRALDGVAPVSRDLAGRAVRLGARAARTWAVADGAETEGFPTREDARRELSLEVTGRLVLFVGNVIPVKGIDVLIDAASRLAARAELADVRFVLVGGGADIPRYEALARARGLADVLRFTGFRPTDEVPSWMAACDVFCLPSRSEGLPNVILEAMGVGRAIVATRVGGVPDLVEHEGNGLLVPSEDPAALADALSRLLAEPRMRERMEARGRELLGARGLTWEATARRYDELYRFLVSGSDPGRGEERP